MAILFLQFAVLYEARANTGVDRMKIINAVAKSVPQPHTVDLSNPDKTIVVQIVKVRMVCGFFLLLYYIFSLISDLLILACYFHVPQSFYLWRKMHENLPMGYPP